MSLLKYKVAAVLLATPEDLQNYGQHFDVKGLEIKDEVVAYKLIAGLSFFYVSPSVYAKCVKEGLVAPLDGSEIREPMGAKNYIAGMYTCFSHLRHSLKESTLPLLKKNLEEMEKLPQRYMVEEWDVHWVRGKTEKPSTEEELQVLHTDKEEEMRPFISIREVATIDVRECRLINLCSFVGKPFINPVRAFDGVETYNDFLEVLASATERTLLNTENIYEALRENDGYERDYLMQRTTMFDFKELKF